jgi:hypothetical protein
MSYLNSVTIVGFVGADPEQRQSRNNGSKFTVLSVVTQRSWKNAEDEFDALGQCPSFPGADLFTTNMSADSWKPRVITVHGVGVFGFSGTNISG